MLKSDNEYNTDLFLEQVIQALQSWSNMTNDGLEFVVLVAQNGSGSGQIKLGTIPYDQIIQKKNPCLYVPDNTHNNLCFSLCLCHFLIPTPSEKEKLAFAQKLQQDLGFTHDHKV